MFHKLMSLFLAVTLLASCSTSSPGGVSDAPLVSSNQSSQTASSITLNLAESKLPSISFSSGELVHSWNEYESLLKDKLQSPAFGELNLVTEQASFNTKAYVSGEFFGYRVVIRGIHWGYVAGFKRTVNHISFIVHHNNKLLTDIHIAAWKQNGRICLGIYVSPQGHSYTLCSPTKEEFIKVFTSILVGIGFVAWLAAEIAKATWPVVKILLMAVS